MMRATLVASLMLTAVSLTPLLGQQGRRNMTPEERARFQAEQERQYQEEMAAPRPIEALNSVCLAAEYA